MGAWEMFSRAGGLAAVNAILAMTIDTALEAKKRALPTIGITSCEFSERIPAKHPARHPTGKNLRDIVDVHVDCHMPYGDSVVKLEGLDATVARVSTIVNSFVAQLLVTRTAEKLLDKGIDPPIWISGNVPGGDEANFKLRKKYPPERFAFGQEKMTGVSLRNHCCTPSDLAGQRTDLRGRSQSSTSESCLLGSTSNLDRLLHDS